MAPKALGWAFAVVVLGGAVANAQVDLGKMLGSLTFGNQDPPSATSDLPPVENLPGPGGGSLPLPDIVAPELENLGNVGTLDLESQEPTIDQNRLLPTTSDIELPMLPSLDSSAPTGIRDVPALPSPPTIDHADLVGAGPIGPAPLAAGSHVDWDDVLASGPTSNVQGGRCDDATAGCATCGCQSNGGCQANAGCKRGCGNRLGVYPFGERVLRATPCLDVPNLPPPTSPAASYRTPACYRDLWSGFAEQRAAECQAHHVHLHGHCGCMNRSACASVSAAPNGCAAGTGGESAGVQGNPGCGCAKTPQGGVRR